MLTPSIRVDDAPQATRPSVLTEDDAAIYLGFRPSALRAWRREGTGPAYVQVRRSIRYRIADLDAWQAKHRVEHES